MPRTLIAGNWKLNGSCASLAELEVIAAAAQAAPRVDVVVCPPFTLIERAVARQGALAVGAQDCHWSASGAYTGNVSAAMLVEAGAAFVILGHSERRQYQHESDADIFKKAEAAIAVGLIAIICVGETATERDEGLAARVVESQLRGSLPIANSDALVVAYEPIWAIGTARTPSLADVAAMHAMIRTSLMAILGTEPGARVRILYGGSVNPANAAELLAVPNVNGALVGGASLTAEAFVPIIKAADPRLEKTHTRR